MRRLGGAAAFAAGLLLALGVALFAVLAPALDAARFERALARNVDERWRVPSADLSRFAADTIGYLRGDTDAWTPKVAMLGAEMPVPDAFAAHMRDVRDAVGLAKGACIGFWAAGAALLAAAWALGKRGAAVTQGNAATRPKVARRGGFPPLPYLMGLAVPVAAALALAAWAAADFNGFWGWLHRAFIRGGIFPADEPVMRLFPLGLFGDYLAPVAGRFAASFCAAAALAVIPRLARRGKGRV